LLAIDSPFWDICFFRVPNLLFWLPHELIVQEGSLIFVVGGGNPEDATPNSVCDARSTLTTKPLEYYFRRGWKTINVERVSHVVTAKQNRFPIAVASAMNQHPSSLLLRSRPIVAVIEHIRTETFHERLLQKTYHLSVVW
jgi:hypothetical protein